MWRTAIIFTILFVAVCRAGQKIPVILVPGDGGSQLQVKLNKTSAPHILCTKHTADFTSLWLNLLELAPGLIDCFADNMRLTYNKTSHTTHNTPGVEIRTPDFGGTSALEWLDPSKVTHIFIKFSYFYPIIDDLVAQGYVRGKSVRGAPYDFRKAPNELGEFFTNLKHLVEDTYQINNKTKVCLLGHSYGNPMTLYFLNQMSQAWKDQYVHSFISLAGVWGGTAKTLGVIASGENLHIPVISPLSVRPEQRSAPSAMFLMPTDRFWNSSEPLVITEKRNYTVNDYKAFFHDIKYTDGYLMHQDTKNLIYKLTPPGVAVHCLHGSGIGTHLAFKYPPGGFPDTYPEAIQGDGDGTVNMRSLLGCLQWSGKQKYPVKHLVLKGAEHLEILRDPRVFEYIKGVVLGGAR